MVLKARPQTITAVLEPSDPIIIIDHPYSTAEVVDQSHAIWTMFEHCVLHDNDRLITMNQNELTDKHIRFAQCLIKQQFPSPCGLYSTLQQNASTLGFRIANAIQIVHCEKRRHWIMVSTKWCKGTHVAVYDSIFAKLDTKARCIVMQTFGLKRTNDIIMMPM